MNKIKVTAIAGGLAMLGVGGWFYRRADAKEVSPYRTAAVALGSVKSTVSATGSLNAVTTVQVGTQVSGQVSAIYVDFNQHVKKGELLARIDPTLQEQAVQDAEAQLERAQATLSEAQAEYQRNKQLVDAKVITPSEFGPIESNFEVQKASVKSAQIALDRAKQQLAYTNIYAPIDGVVVERDVDVGQTVAASLSAPKLFVIANDLTDMQILANVDESDIGQIKNGQPVQFTVQSYPSQQFTGTVQQVRLQSTTQDNVVNYTVVVGVKNTAGKLLPGMTATVNFLTASADSVLTVPNAALRIKPTAQMLAAAGMTDSAKGDSTRRSTRDSTQRGAQGGNGARWAGQHAGGMGLPSGVRPSIATLWVMDSTGTPKPVRVRTGLTDGSKTEVKGRDLTAGAAVLVGISDPAAATGGAEQAPASSPFQQQRGGPRGRGGF
ncbi:MAG TPA: efflux RND transporter periplasmic adaptor subunit [Gemmatimonadaceae bacterium]|nr:efflux RND transporter periplasmic adaptor subunit [Gemmatimonadaceae bacterium]